MGIYTARKRENPFAAQSRQKRAEEKARAKAARNTKAPAPAPTQPAAVPYVHENEVSAADNLTETPDVATVPASNDVELPMEVDTESDVKLFEPLPEDEQPLGDLREVAELAESANTSGAVEIENATVTMTDDRGRTTVHTGDVRLTPLDEDGQPVKRGRGRPRPQETIDRDNDVLSVLQTNPEGVSKSELAELLNEKEQQVYSSLRSLSKDGKARTTYVKDVGGYRWFAA